MNIVKFPKLVYPLNTKGMDPKDRLLMLAYDIIWRSQYGDYDSPDYMHDLSANLMSLGSFITYEMPNGGAQRFDPHDADPDSLFSL